jgi:lipoyl-dependent peroxiredoxin
MAFTPYLRGFVLDVGCMGTFQETIASKQKAGRQRLKSAGRKFYRRQERYKMDRSASAVWQGGLKDGHGVISTQSGTLHEAQYSFSTRFENGVGTNPEELIAAAHAGCFTMALSGQLTSVEYPPQSLETTAVVTMEKTDDGPTITKIHLTTRAKVANIEKEKFDELAKKAKEGCPISRLLKAAEITLDAQLV